MQLSIINSCLVFFGKAQECYYNCGQGPAQHTPKV
jgi:hypothetical protein